MIPDEQFAQAYDYCAEGMGYEEMQATMRSTYWGFSYDPSAAPVPGSLPPDQHPLSRAPERDGPPVPPAVRGVR